MASEVKREKIFGNFKKSRTEGPQPAKNSGKLKNRPGMSKDHLTLIRKMPCAICLCVPCGEAHHAKSIPGTRGAGMRAEDRYAVGLCRADHEMVERAGTRNEMKIFKEVGIDLHLLVGDLWGVRGDLPKMIKVLMAHRGSK